MSFDIRPSEVILKSFLSFLDFSKKNLVNWVDLLALLIDNNDHFEHFGFLAEDVESINQAQLQEA
jgi:hypothetical protein